MKKTTIIMIAATFMSFACKKDREDQKDDQNIPNPPQPGHPATIAIETADLYDMEIQAKGLTYIPVECDAITFTAIYGFAGGNIDIGQFLDPEDAGLVHRTPGHDCYETGRSGSQCSRDGYLPYAMNRYLAKDRGALKAIIDRAIAKKLIMCEGDISRTAMTPELLWTIVNAYRDLGGNNVTDIDIDNVILKFNDGNKSLKLKGFEKHLKVLHTWFKTWVYDGASESNIKILKGLTEENPENGLFHAIYHLYSDGDQSGTWTLVNDKRYFPRDRLPTVDDRCEPYLWQRNMGDDWEPCPGSDKQGHGVDHIVATRAAYGLITP